MSAVSYFSPTKTKPFVEKSVSTISYTGIQRKTSFIRNNSKCSKKLGQTNFQKPLAFL